MRGVQGLLGHTIAHCMRRPRGNRPAGAQEQWAYEAGHLTAGTGRVSARAVVHVTWPARRDGGPDDGVVCVPPRPLVCPLHTGGCCTAP